MALSQLQCLDENHVNPRTHENKPEFLYCENQRLALEVLLRDGREAFRAFLKARDVRGFLSDSELDVLTRLVVPYDPGSDVLHASPLEDGGGDGDGVPLSLHYWPDLSDTSVPELDLGWPDSASYRGVTRTNVYTQPPQESQAHIKEIIRKAIAQAQKVIAVVMDLFTDVDIFRDLLEAGYKRKVSVYILLEASNLPHFLSMCDRANMHPGQLKNLRVRCAGGGEFLTRSCTRLRGRLGHRFMFVDGDKAVSGSYRYTWMSSRLDRHLITVVTGQAVDAFDRLFRELYGTSSAVDLKRVAMELEPEPEYLPQPVVVVPSAEVTRKRHNPMYALLGMSMNNANPASGPDSPLDSNSQDKAGMGTEKAKRKMAAKAAQVEAPPLHPGLMDMEKAYMIPYLPTWPEPDPPSDVIGFINVRDHSRQTQVHLQRSERFETSQAIRFSSPFSMPKETLPEVAQLRQRDTNLQDIRGKKAYPTQVSTQEVAVDKAQPISLNTRPSTLATQPRCGRDVHMVLNKSVHILTSETKIKAEKPPFNTESKPSTDPASRQIPTSHIDTLTSFSNKAPIIKTESAVPSRPVHNLIKETIDTEKKIHNEHLSNFDHMLTSNPASSHVQASPIAIYQQNAAPPVQTQNRIAHKVSCKQDLDTKPQSPSIEDFTPSIPSPALSCTISASPVSPAHPALGRFTSPSVTTSASVTSSPSRTITTFPVVPPASPSISSPLPPFSIPSSVSNPSINAHFTNTSPLPCSGPSTSPLSPPVPKPRTIHMVMDSGRKCNVLNQSLDSGVVLEHAKLSGSGPVVDDCKPVFKQQEDAIMTSTRKQIRPNTLFNSTTKYVEWQDRKDIQINLPDDVKDGLSKEFPDPKKATDQSILTVNTLQANDNQFKETKPKESWNTNEAGYMLRSPRVIEELSKPDKDNKGVTKPHLQKATQHVLTNEDILQQHSQTHTAQASESPSSFHAPENNNVIDSQHIPKLNNDTRGCLSMNVVNSISCAQTQGGQRLVPSYPFNDEAVNNVHDRLNSDKGKAEMDSHTPEKPTLPNNLEFTSPTTASRLSPLTPTRRTSDGRSCYSPDIRTPTSDTSDGYVSSREDSTLSTTSDEYYECDETLLLSPVFDQGIGLDNRMTDDRFRAQTKYGVESERESEREYQLWIGEDRAAILAAGERSQTGSEGLSQTAKKGSRLPQKTTKPEKSIIYNSPQGQSDPLEPVVVDVNPRSASAKKSADIETSPPPILHHILRRSSSSASSENTVSPFITPVPSPAPTPTPKRAATQPRVLPPDTEVGRPAVVSGTRVQPEGKQVLRRDSRGESAELARTWENFRRYENNDPERFTKVDLGTSSGELHSETSALVRTSGAQMRRGPWIPRETEGKKGLQTPPGTPQGWAKQQKQHSPVSFQSPDAKPARPTLPSSVPQLPRSYQLVSSRVDQEYLQTLQNNSAPKQPQYRRHSSMTPAGSLKGADQKSPSEAFSRHSLNYGQPLAVQSPGSLPKPLPSFLYSYTNSQSKLHSQTQPIIASDQMAQTVSSQQSTYRKGSAMGDQEPGDSGQDLGKTGFSISVAKLYSIKGLKNKGSSSPSQTKRNPDSLAQPRKSTG